MEKKEKIVDVDVFKTMQKDLKDCIKKNMALYKNCIKLQNKVEKRDKKIEELLKKLKNTK